VLAPPAVEHLGDPVPVPAQADAGTAYTFYQGLTGAAGNVIWLVGSSATLEGTTVAAGNIVALASITLDGGASLAGRAIALNGSVTMIGRGRIGRLC
jgi:hypothetical protein